MEEQKDNQQESNDNSVVIPEIVVEQLRNNAKEKVRAAVHTWKQKGGWVKCNSCEFPHAIRIGGGDRLTGINEIGMPVLERREGQIGRLT